MRTSLWFTVATAALIAGTTFATAQQNTRSGESATEQHGGAAPGATKMQGAGESQRSGTEHKDNMGRAENRESGSAQRTGEDRDKMGRGESKENMGRENKERTGRGEDKERMGRSDEKERAGHAEGKEGAGRDSKDSTGRGESREHTGRGDNKEHTGRGESKEQTGRSETKEQMRQGETRERAGGREREGSQTEVREQSRGRSGTSVQLSQDQRTRVRDVVVKGHSEARINHVDFDVSVGTVVPRSIRVHHLPGEIVEIVPEYRGYDYIIVGDEIVIIEPDTLRIIAVIPA